ncbi:NADH-cytochrome b5 reductase 2 [Erysiphe necator]|nr:NADH-cytochrome b5 reductase 2 [Erysiphe necator]
MISLNKFNLHPGQVSATLIFKSYLVNSVMFNKMAVSRLYNQPFSVLISCQDMRMVRWRQRVGKLKSIDRVFNMTKNSSTSIFGRASNLNSRTEYFKVYQDSDLVQKSKISSFGPRFLKLAFASLSLSIFGWLIAENFVLQNQNDGIFNPPKFTPFEIIKKEAISSTAFLLSLRSMQKHPDMCEPDPFEKWWTKGIWSVEVKQPELQISRSYTPLPPLRGEPLDYITFLIRKNYRGEMTGYLNRLQEKSIIQLRGPYQELEIPPTVNQILFLAGGTGISPALQIIHKFLERRNLKDIKPSIHIVWANRRREDCYNGFSSENKDDRAIFPGSRENQNNNPIVDYLNRMQQLHPDELTIQYFVDEEGSKLNSKTLAKLIQKFSKNMPENSLSQSQTQSRLLLVSGPEGFIEFIAGAKKLLGSQDQGELDGILKNIEMKNWGVWIL